ncbi:uncharacterized protein [Haliotis asinina]|uniref:uncharacterized protein n=1 Tax=Haliotis asinina TaxID=109174 RepID=UPI0035326B4E
MKASQLCLLLILEPASGVEISTSYDYLQLLPLSDNSWVQIECIVVESFSMLPAACRTVEDSVVDYDVDVPVYRSDPKASIYVKNPSYVDEAAGFLVVTASNEDLPPTGVWTFSYATTDDTATAGQDYIGASKTDQVVTSNRTSFDIVLRILDDNVGEDSEEFLLMLTDFSGGDPNINVTIIILDNERFSLYFWHYGNTREGTQHVQIHLYKHSSRFLIQTELTLLVNTMDVTATAGKDYVPVPRLVTFAAGDNQLILGVIIIDDKLMEPSESFIITVNSSQLINNLTIPVNIEDNDHPVNSDCGRLGQYCQNGGLCLQEDGICWCSSSYIGPNCATHKDDIQGGSGCDSLHCVHGTCMSNGTLARCACDRNYTGELCDKATYFSQCNPNNISICITPPRSINAITAIYIKDHRETPDCKLALAPTPPDPNDGIVDWCEGYAAVFRYNTSCGEVESIAERMLDCKLFDRYCG